ncbi:MAG: hypothetical protein ACLF0G_04480 [Candidatus Brocadiia bacterium]
MGGLRTRNRRAFVAVEVAAVVAVIALLLAMGFMLYRGMRLAARASLAESNLKQVSTGMELYFRKYNSYPPEGSDLTAELAPFVTDPDAFANPLKEEQSPGETLNALYKEPSLEQLDSPDHYITSLVSEDGRTVVVLKTGGKVERRNDLRFDPDAPPGDLVAMLDPETTTSSGDGDDDVVILAAPDEPTDTSSPDDHSNEVVPGVIKVLDDVVVDFEVIETALSSGTTDLDVFVEGKFGKAITYVVVQDGVSRVKFEDAPEGLGEDDAQETDRFVMSVQGTTDSVTVSTKAATGKATTTLPAEVGATAKDELGFVITVESISDDSVYTLSVSSESNEHALSHVEFDFGEGTEVEVTEDVTRMSGEPLFGGADVDGGEFDSKTLAKDQSFALIGIAGTATYASDVHTSQVLTLRNGDQAFEDPATSNIPITGTPLEGLIDPVTGTVTIENDQVLFLFELGTIDPSSSAFDLDDLVVLATLKKTATSEQ